MQMKIKFYIFLIIGIASLLFFYFSDYYFNLNIGDSYYVVNYFYPTVFVLIIGSVIYFFKMRKHSKSSY